MVKVDTLKSIIQARNITAQEVADRLNIDRSTFFRKLEKGGSTFTVEQAKALGALLNLSQAELNLIFFAE